MSLHLFVRELHILLGALWYGIAVYTALFVGPAVASMGPEGGRFMQAMQKRGLIVFMPVLAVLTILTGVWLFWRFTAGFTPEISATHAGRAYSAGAALAVIVFLIGALVISRALVRAGAITKQAASAPEAERPSLLARASALRKRAEIGGQIVALLLTIVVVLMSVAMYI